MRRDVGTAAAEDLRGLGIGSDHRDGFDLLERERAIILEQDNRFARRLTDDLAMLRFVLRPFRLEFRILEQPGFFQHAQQAADFIIEQLLPSVCRWRARS